MFVFFTFNVCNIEHVVRSVLWRETSAEAKFKLKQADIDLFIKFLLDSKFVSRRFVKRLLSTFCLKIDLGRKRHRKALVWPFSCHYTCWRLGVIYKSNYEKLTTDKLQRRNFFCTRMLIKLMLLDFWRLREFQPNEMDCDILQTAVLIFSYQIWHTEE